MPPEARVRWFGARSTGEASLALASRAAVLARAPGEWVLGIGRPGGLRRSLERRLTRLGVTQRWVTTADEISPPPQGAAAPACLIAADVDALSTMRVARRALSDPRLRSVPLEFVTGLEPEQRQFRRHDEYADQGFVSPVLLAEPSPYALYAESLERFEQKCGLRDFLDLYQMLVSVHEREVPGAVAEFGTYRGHSGWLIARSLQALGSTRAVHLFDTFESFPPEPEGIDYFWSQTHRVDFDEVRAKLSELPGVRLVRGEFEDTLPRSDLEEIALAYVDCDSHRAVSYLAEALFEHHLSPGGVIVFEDYGHPALLGCRLAVHEYFDGRKDCTRFFSQFSGLYIVVKMPGAR
jgi:predicted O-methyltransferase YrrM